MFSVLFEVNPREGQWDTYLMYAKMLRPELGYIDGFIDNVRYASLTRPGWIMSLSGWHNEKALVRWRTRARHHDVQVKGRTEVLANYRLRVGQLTVDTQLPEGCTLTEQRLDETQAGESTTATLVSADRPVGMVRQATDGDVAGWLGVDTDAVGLVSWDVYDALLSPRDIIAVLFWRDQVAADNFRSQGALPEDARVRQIRIVRDYGMYDRRENPQYYPDNP
jgi:heme-degrading monooxygenase HmoA